jgi:hypothetical protein
MPRCGANCLDCTIEMQKQRGYSCRFKELNYDPILLAKLRKEEWDKKCQNKTSKPTNHG